VDNQAFALASCEHADLRRRSGNRGICKDAGGLSTSGEHVVKGGAVRVGLFNRRAPDSEQPDEALSFFTSSTANDFRGVAREVFAELGLEVVIHPDHAVDDAGRQFGFWNVAAQCADERRPEWNRVVREHVERVLESMDAPDPFTDIDPSDVAQRTYARLYAEDGLPPLDKYPHREFVPGVVEMLALDLPETVAFFDHENAARLGGWEALQAQGMTNLQSLPVESLETLDAPGGGIFNALLGDSVFTGSRALLLPGLATQLTGEAVSEFGWLMSIPNRQQVVWHMIRDSTVVNAVNGMAHFTMLGYSDAPGPVSPHVYWWNGSAYEQLTQIDENGAISVHAGPAFSGVLNTLVDGE